MPDNFLMLGMIDNLAPSASVIVCSRDLRDVALSCWQTPFGTNPWTNRLEHIARRLADHQRLLAPLETDQTGRVARRCLRGAGS